MTYQKEIKTYLENYKKTFLNHIADGKWRDKQIGYPHILPKDSEDLNLLPTYKKELLLYLDANKTTLNRHIYFHHLNSSQAMCLNFFFPLLKEKKVDVIMNAIGLHNEEVDYNQNCFFEKESHIEKMFPKYRATCFDFFIQTISGKKIYFEIKYTEQKFGAAKSDDTHIKKFKNVYRNQLMSIEKQFQSEKTFLSNYQILRNLICVSENSYVVFIYPNNNKKIKAQAEFAKGNYLRPELKSHLINKTWEDLTTYVQKNAENKNIQSQLKEFRDKYKV